MASARVIATPPVRMYARARRTSAPSPARRFLSARAPRWMYSHSSRRPRRFVRQELSDPECSHKLSARRSAKHANRPRSTAPTSSVMTADTDPTLARSKNVSPHIGLEQEATAITCYSMYYMPVPTFMAEKPDKILEAVHHDMMTV